MVIFSKSRRRATAPFVLALWMFALLASMAHACGLGEALDGATWSEAAAVGWGTPSGDDTLPACDQFCADDIPILAKLTAVEDGPAGSTLLPAAPIAYTLRLPDRASSSVVARPEPAPDPAINTRYVRLAL
jgi:hypothetical protein